MLSSALKAFMGQVGSSATSSIYSNRLDGYIGGGAISGGRSDKIEKFSYTTESAAFIAGTLNYGLYNVTGLPGQDAAYFLGGEDYMYLIGAIKDITKVLFSTDATSLISQKLNNIGGNRIPLSTTTKGFSLQRTYNGSDYTEIDVLAYDTDTTSVSATTIDRHRERAGYIDGQAKGYYIGGNAVSTTYYKQIHSLDYATEVRALLAEATPNNTNSVASLTSATTGFVCFGDALGTRFESVTEFDFASETTAEVLHSGIKLSGAKGLSAPTQGYFLGGSDGTTSYKDRVSRYDMATNTHTLAMALLSDNLRIDYGAA